jgi:membrane protease YdiL (CAAX protease family)
VPFVIIKFIFQENLKTYGITFGDWQIGLEFFFFSILLFIPVIYFISVADQFNSYFPLMLSAKNDLVVFLIYETLFILFIFSWEFIFRGFMLFGLEKKFGFYSIFIQMLPFVLLHSGKPFIETFSSIFGGIILGYLALRTRSIYYGFLIHVLILITLDVIALFK